MALSERDFDELIDLDRSDSRRHSVLAAGTVALAVLIPAAASYLNAQDALDTLSKYAGVGAGLLSAFPAAKMLAISRNIDRIQLVRQKWRRLSETPKESEDDLKKISELVWSACK